MPIGNTDQHYGTITKTFHWLTALIIITIIPLGLIANRLPYENDAQLALKAQLFSYHKTLGVLIFAVALLRIIWAITQPKPGNLHPERRLETWLAELVHWLLYISLVAVPLTGWIHHAATTGFAPILLPIGQSLPLVPKSESVAELFGSLHWIWSKIMVGSVLLHIAGALKHHFIDKDTTLPRMWFGRAATPEVPPHHNHLVAPLMALGIFGLATAGGAATGIFDEHDSAAAPSLEAVASDWTVTEGAIEISVIQLGSEVTGQFDEWTASITFDPDATGVMGNVNTTIAVQSLQLGSVSGQAMEADFFDVATFPTAEFSADITQDGEAYLATGTLSIKGTEVPVTLHFNLTLEGGTAQMDGALTLDRRDFSIGESMADESSVAFPVEVSINVTATRANP